MINEDSRWLPTKWMVETANSEPRTQYGASPVDGEEPAFHPMFDTFEESVSLCVAMNKLDYTEDDYFDNYAKIRRALDTGTLDEYVANVLNTKKEKGKFWDNVKRSFRR